MLSNENTLDWEDWLPALMFSYNTQVHKSTMESPFFLTYLHDPKMPFFDIDAPKPMYKHTFAQEAAARLGTAYKSARQNMEEARNLREKYYNQRSQAREFSVGDRCLVYFEASPRAANRKFLKKWKGVYTVTDVVGKVNLKLRATPQSKPILVHVDRVKHLRQEDFHRHFDSKVPKPDSPSSAEEETNPPEPARRPRQLKRKKRTPRAGTPPQEYQLIREQRLLAGEFREYIVTDNSDYLTADESPTPSEGEAPQLAAAQPEPNQVNVQEALQARHDRNARPNVIPAGAEESGTEVEEDNPFLALQGRVTRRRAQEEEIPLSEGLPARTRRPKNK